MLTAEKYFALALDETLNVDPAHPVQCSVADPDPNWVRDQGGDAACCFVDEDRGFTGVSDGSIRRAVIQGEKTIVYRSKGWIDMMMEVQIRGQNKTRLNALAGLFRDTFCCGYAFGPQDDANKFQITTDPAGNLIRPAPDEQRFFARLYRFTVRGPWEVTTETWPVKTVESHVS